MHVDKHIQAVYHLTMLCLKEVICRAMFSPETETSFITSAFITVSSQIIRLFPPPPIKSLKTVHSLQFITERKPLITFKYEKAT